MMAAAKKNPKSNVNAKLADSNKTNKLIRENMKCPVCMEVLLPPIYQCETGHNICYLCVEEVQECPLCKSDYGETRNYFAEELVNSMSFPCKFEDYGCTKTMFGRELKDHQESCEFQPYRCPELACQELCGLHQMGSHLDRHGFKILKGVVQVASIEIQDDHFDRKTEYNPWRIGAFNKEFYTVATHQTDSKWYFWCYCLRLPKDAKKYSCEIVVFTKERQVLFRGPVHSLRSQPDSIMEQGTCLILTDSLVKALRMNGKLQIRVAFIQGKKWMDPTKAVQRALTKERPGLMGKGKVKVTNGPPTARPATTPFPSKVGLVGPRPHSQVGQIGQIGVQSGKPLTGGIKIAKVGTGPTTMTKSAGATQNNNKTGVSKSVKELTATLSELASSGKIISKPFSKSTSTTSLGREEKSISHVQNKISDQEQDFVVKMKEILCCPGCNDVISPPVHQCQIGHSMCHKCKMSRTDCAICRAPLSNTRNFFAEELLYKVYQQCSFCDVCLPSAQIRLHETLCPSAPFECPFNSCRKLVSPSELLGHLKSHQIDVVCGEVLKGNIDVPRIQPATGPVCAIPQILDTKGKAFYPCVLRETSGNWSFFVSSEDHSEFVFELVLTKMTKTLAFRGPVVSLRVNQTDIQKFGGSLVLTERMVKTLMHEEKLSYSLKIYHADEKVESTDSILAACGHSLKSTVSRTQLFANKKTSTNPEDELEGVNDDVMDVVVDVNSAATFPEVESETQLSVCEEVDQMESPVETVETDNLKEVPPCTPSNSGVIEIIEIEVPDVPDVNEYSESVAISQSLSTSELPESKTSEINKGPSNSNKGSQEFEIMSNKKQKQMRKKQKSKSKKLSKSKVLSTEIVDVDVDTEKMGQDSMAADTVVQGLEIAFQEEASGVNGVIAESSKGIGGVKELVDNGNAEGLDLDIVNFAEGDRDGNEDAKKIDELMKRLEEVKTTPDGQ